MSARGGKAARIASIIRSHALLFAEGEEEAEYEALLDFKEHPRAEKIERIVSILRAEELIFGAEGLVPSGEDASREIADLIRYAESLGKDGSQPRLAALIPKNLGSAFAKKGYGLPLFGAWRPDPIPAEGGVILCYRSPDRDGSARVEAFRNTAGVRLAYLGIGLRFSASVPVLECLLLPEGSEPGRDEAGGDLFRFSRCAIHLAREARPLRFVDRVVDPYAYEYAYFFFEDRRLFARLAGFLAELLSGVFAVPFREAETIAGLFSARLL